MKVLLVGALLVCSAISFTQASNPSLDNDWAEFKKSHHKTYATSEEEAKRRAIWEDTVAYIKKHNDKRRLGLAKLSRNITIYWADPDRVRKAQAQLSYAPKRSRTKAKITKDELPSSIDWRDLGAVTPVRDQGLCRSCWAFASSAAMESAFFIQTGNLIVLSPENFVDCIDTGEPKPNRCEGDYCEDAFEWAKNGITTEAAYPYVAFEGAPAELTACKPKTNQLKVRTTGEVLVEEGSELALMEAIANVGPVTVLINQAIEDNKQYTGGVFDDTSCNNTFVDLNHALLAVGYGTTEDGVDYWIIKNSYGTDWGDQGYLYLKRGENICGISLWNWYPLL
ncbi:putative Digestive cysteine proteinase 2 [Hypsibius exemplaris]|uniref:Digestive cysteine proteinase 2 n=1 Tax=Hypsibius exemplaris TaxID=2072580 RepID=A0A1W0X5D2_HYPEX|nr:putative Digestive cysteine proteinase 2 [Hypsibius exemplaris]